MDLKDNSGFNTPTQTEVHSAERTDLMRSNVEEKVKRGGNFQLVRRNLIRQAYKIEFSCFSAFICTLLKHNNSKDTTGFENYLDKTSSFPLLDGAYEC